MLLLLVFICEDAIVNPWSKIAIKGIISILVLMFVGGLRATDLTSNEESRKKVQHIYKLSSRMSSGTHYTHDNPTPIMPVLDSDEDNATTVHALDEIDRNELVEDETKDPPASIKSKLIVQYKVKRPLQLMAKWADFIMDSGCTAHVISSPNSLYDLRTSRSDRQMGRIQGCIAGSLVKINGFGTLFPLGNVLVAPYISNNLISVPQLTKDGFTIVITEKKMHSNQAHRYRGCDTNWVQKRWAIYMLSSL